MKLSKITFTGIDESCNIEELSEFAKKYPFIEFGILVTTGLNMSYGNKFMPRFPSLDTIKQFTKAIPKNQLSIHLCGQYSSELFKTIDAPVTSHLIEELNCDRFQINWSPRKKNIDILILNQNI